VTGPSETGREVRRPTVNLTSHVTEIKPGHVWTGQAGDTYGALDLGATWIAFHSPQQAREAAAALAELAASMEAHAARQGGTS
jgi:hypothetical protein